MRTTQPQISINGDDYVNGTISAESDGGLRSWHGEVHAAYPVGEQVRVLAFADGSVYLGEAMISSIEHLLPDHADPISRFLGNGRLVHWTLKELAEILERTDPEPS